MMDWKNFTDEKPYNNEEVLVWFNGEGVQSAELMEYSEDANGYWSCECDYEIYHPDRWCRIVPPNGEKS